MVPGSLSFSILSWSFSFFPMIGCILSQEEQNQCLGQSQATECWANTHEWVRLWLLLIPWGSPNNPASPSFQCFFVLLLWSSTEVPEDLSCCSRGKNDCKSLGHYPGDTEIKHTFSFSWNPEVKADLGPIEKQGPAQKDTEDLNVSVPTLNYITWSYPNK